MKYALNERERILNFSSFSDWQLSFLNEIFPKSCRTKLKEWSFNLQSSFSLSLLLNWTFILSFFSKSLIFPISILGTEVYSSCLFCSWLGHLLFTSLTRVRFPLYAMWRKGWKKICLACIKISNLSSTFRKCSEERTDNNTTPHSPKLEKQEEIY